MNRADNVSATAQGFDAAALSFDHAFDGHPAGRRVRRIMQEVLRRYFKKGDSVLEMGCGTGTDAVFLAEQGVQVLATDVSQEMLQQAEQKALQTEVASLITTRCLAMEQIATLGGSRFDGAFSNFGGLNCVREPGAIADSLARMIAPGGHVVLCLMTDFCLWETVAFLARGRFADAFRRRRREGMSADVQGLPVQVFYHNPGGLIERFSRTFDLLEMGGLNILTPPPSSRRAYARLGSGARILEKFDDLLCRLPVFRQLGDHYYVVFRRNAAAPSPGGSR